MWNTESHLLGFHNLVSENNPKNMQDTLSIQTQSFLSTHTSATLSHITVNKMLSYERLQQANKYVPIDILTVFITAHDKRIR